MEHCRLYIADMDGGFVAQVRGALHHSGRIQVVGSSDNGKHALREIVRLCPDVVMTDICLPELDGISLLRETRRMKRPPAVIVCTRLCSQASMQCASKYGATFILCKPLELQSLPLLIAECAQSIVATVPFVKETDDGELKRLRAIVVRNLLQELGLSSKLDGYAYILEAALHFRGDALLLKNLSRGLYAQIAGRMDTTVPRIERSLRSAIAIAYERGTLSRRFPRRPTNRQFIEFVLRELEQAECRKA